MKIKICGLTKRENIEELVQLNPDYLGFIFYPGSPRFINGKLTPADMESIAGNIPRVGVFVNASFDEISGSFRRYNLDYVQLHGSESPEFCKQLDDSGIEVIKAFSLDDAFDFNRLMEYVPFTRFFLFDTQTELPGGSGRKFNWKILENYPLAHPFLLSGGIGPDDAAEVLSLQHPALWGVDLNSRFEISPGIKDIAKLKDFIQTIRAK